MNTQTSNTGFMPRSVAITLLTSNQSKTNGFRKRCLRAMEKIIQPKNRVSDFSPAAPATGEQKLSRKFGKATFKQLLKWKARNERRGNRLQDLLFEAQVIEGKEKLVDALQQRIAAHNTVNDFLNKEIDKRHNRSEVV